MSSAADRARKRQQNADQWPIRRFALGGEPEVDCRDLRDPEQRLAAMWPLAVQHWRLSGRSLPTYTRAEIPSMIFRKHDER